ncbi:MAG: signal recognition particle protein [Acidobacteria bacterium 13_1_40CM_2_68_5]|nr:MAG: signal recognition particle protein [Acidobacteria bacterium 13_1_40CM_2_68_5]OLE67905.1 MAG: signal recognition particle protein [Acidobacteria bacterium 13_1_20CM_2_68_7]
MFEALGERLQTIFRRLRGHGHLTESEIREGVREIRTALLEADVDLSVVKEFTEVVRRKAMSEEILKSLTPGHQVVKVVRDEMIAILGQGDEASLKRASQTPSVYLMVGLQGSGKTTTSAKLARLLKGLGRSPLLVPADVRRPAAVEQLGVLAGEIGVPVAPAPPGEDAAAVCRAALKEARQVGRDPLVVDTAGRLHIDEDLMSELAALKTALEPVEILYVADAMTGQDTVRAASAFHARLALTGVILSKADGDARGGAALSIRRVLGVPIKFIGVGEHMENLEPFHPDRMASRILGMGDVLTLIEKAEAAASVEESEALARRLKRSELTLEDLADQLDTMKRLGSLRQILDMLPGAASLKDMPLDEKGIVRTRAIISSMTRDERLRPEIIDGRRRVRIARGSGTAVSDVNVLLKQFKQMRKMMKSMARGGPGMRSGLLGAARSFRR